MKKLLFFTLIFSLYYMNINAQVSLGGTPLSFDYPNLEKIIDFISIPAPNLDALASEDAERVAKSEPYRIGVSIPVDLNLNNSGTWINLPDNNGSLWRLSLRSESALAIGLSYRDFFLPEGATLFIYNKDKSMILGAYTEINNIDNRSFANEYIQGDEFTLELFVPENRVNQVALNISSVEYFYRGINFPNQSKSSDYCEVDINCPEGANWQDEKKGICKIDIKIGSAWFNCTGSLMNNTKNDCKPYILLADHCIYYGGYPSASDYNSWVFRFHYERTTCGGSTNAAVKTMTGCALKAHDTYGQTYTGSDFCLVQLNSTIPTTHNVYYYGWDRSTSASSSGVGIHHPSADVMKISTYTTTLTNSNYGTTHWKVYWAATVTEHGVTEEGSSGSPLFNSSGRVVGTLTGGSSYCSTPNDPDHYGKFSKHWDANGSVPAKRLKDWLDPTPSTGVTYVNGIATCNSAGIFENFPQEEKIQIYPSPANDEIYLNFSVVGNKIENVIIYNIMGVAVKNTPLLILENGKASINISDLSDGVYFLTAQNDKVIFKGDFIKLK